METLSPNELLKKAKNLYEEEEYEEAAKLFEAAEAGYTAQKSFSDAAEMANNRSVALLMAHEPQAALDAVGETIAFFAEQKDTKRQAMALGNKAAALDALKQYEAAEAAYIECAALLKDLGETEFRTAVMQSISRLQMRTGRQLEAVASMQSGLEGVEKPNIRQRLVKRLLNIPMNMLNKSGSQDTEE